MTSSQRRALEELWPVFGIDFSAREMVFNRVFDRDAPVVLEIGFGNGETLVELAAAHPELDCIGLEVHEPGVGHCLLKAQDAGVGNLRLIMHDAVEVLKQQVPSDSLARVNIYFPDPWPKKRHHKRRLIQPAFLELLASRIRPRGLLCVATDWADYAAHIDDVVGDSGLFVLVERREHAGDAPLDRPQTKFERRGLKEGHGIVDWCFGKAANNQ